MKATYEVKLPDEPWKWAHTVEAYSHEEAVEKAADYNYSECDGWEWMKDKDTEFHVRREGEENHQAFLVMIEYDPVFYAREK